MLQENPWKSDTVWERQEVFLLYRQSSINPTSKVNKTEYRNVLFSQLLLFDSWDVCKNKCCSNTKNHGSYSFNTKHLSCVPTPCTEYIAYSLLHPAPVSLLISVRISFTFLLPCFALFQDDTTIIGPGYTQSDIRWTQDWTALGGLTHLFFPAVNLAWMWTVSAGAALYQLSPL